MTKIWLGPQGEYVEVRETTDSAVESRTDREAVEQAIIGPQGEKIFPTAAPKKRGY